MAKKADPNHKKEKTKQKNSPIVQKRKRRKPEKVHDVDHVNLEQFDRKNAGQIKEELMAAAQQFRPPICEETQKNYHNKQSYCIDQQIIDEENDQEDVSMDNHNPIILLEKERKPRANLKSFAPQQNSVVKNNIEISQLQNNTATKTSDERVVQSQTEKAPNRFEKISLLQSLEIEKEKQTNRNNAIVLADPESNPKYKDFISKKSFFKKKRADNCEETLNEKHILNQSSTRVIEKCKPLLQKMQTQNSKKQCIPSLISNKIQKPINSPPQIDKGQILLETIVQNNVKETQQITKKSKEILETKYERRIRLKKQKLKLDSKVVVESIYIRVINNIQNQSFKSRSVQARSYQKKTCSTPILEYYQPQGFDHFHTKVMKTRNRNRRGNHTQRFKEVIIEEHLSDAEFKEKIKNISKDQPNCNKNEESFEETFFKRESHRRLLSSLISKQ